MLRLFATVTALARRSLKRNVFVLLRFANRIPLVFDEGSDVITKTANELKYVLDRSWGMLYARRRTSQYPFLI